MVGFSFYVVIIINIDMPWNYMSVCVEHRRLHWFPSTRFYWLWTVQELARRGSGSQEGLGEHISQRRRSKNAPSNGPAQADVRPAAGMLGAEMC